MRPLLLIALAMAAPAGAEIKASSPNGFEMERRAVVPAAPAVVQAQLGRIGEWWDPKHTYSGDTANLRLDLKAGGCFCEALGNGGTIEHLRTVYFNPADGLRLQGGLGPLQREAVAGTLSWTWKAVPGGTELVLNYVVAGTVRGGMQTLAAPVDGVMGEQFDRLVARLSKAK